MIKDQEASGLLSSLGTRTSLSQIPLVRPYLFQMYKMNEIIHEILLAGDKFMPKMRLSPAQIYVQCLWIIY